MLQLKLITRVLIYFLKWEKSSSALCYHRNVELLKDKTV